MSLDNPYLTDDGEPTLLQSYCTIADVLGFTMLTERAYETGGQLDMLLTLYRAIESCRHWLDPAVRRWKHHPATWQYKLYSDNVIAGHPCDLLGSEFRETQWYGAVAQAAAFQIAMATSGFFMRGGMAIGDLHISDSLVFGRALVDAHAMDVPGGPPRICLHSSCLKEVAAQVRWSDLEDSPHYTELIVEDGSVFLDYLFLLLEPAGQLDTELLEGHREAVGSGLVKYANDDRVLPKYRWAAAYHNYVCDYWAPWSSRLRRLRLAEDVPSHDFRRLTEADVTRWRSP
ncbi:MAG: hypothetical protein HYU66_11270 [Armatimonadetes bacterium]|nr:hypothetical protein [Armatimonadota bacterium]